MEVTSDAIAHDDTYDLNRFIRAQREVYNRILGELKSGMKRTHWMWFVFPQIHGLGHSATAVYYAIKSIGEAQAYLNHPLLGSRLLECTEAVLTVEGRSASQIFSYPDDIKLKSSMTLFASVADSESLFVRVLDKYFKGERDDWTLQILEKLKEKK